jgi:hypothetical protein
MNGSPAKTPIDYCSHNHSVNDIKAYPEHRGLSEDQVRVVRASKTAGVPVNRIKASLKAADPESEVSSRDIYNWTARIAREGRGGRPPNEALIEKLTTLKEEGSLFFEYTLTEEGRIQRLFLADMR